MNHLAVILEKSYTRCQVRLQNGVDDLGDPIYVNRVLGRILPDASHQDLYDVVQAVFSLQSLPISIIRRIDDGELIEE